MFQQKFSRVRALSLVLIAATGCDDPSTPKGEDAVAQSNEPTTSLVLPSVPSPAASTTTQPSALLEQRISAEIASVLSRSSTAKESARLLRSSEVTIALAPLEKSVRHPDGLAQWQGDGIVRVDVGYVQKLFDRIRLKTESDDEAFSILGQFLAPVFEHEMGHRQVAVEQAQLVGTNIQFASAEDELYARARGAALELELLVGWRTFADRSRVNETSTIVKLLPEMSMEFGLFNDGIRALATALPKCVNEMKSSIGQRSVLDDGPEGSRTSFLQGYKRVSDFFSGPEPEEEPLKGYWNLGNRTAAVFNDEAKYRALQQYASQLEKRAVTLLENTIKSLKTNESQSSPPQK